MNKETESMPKRHEEVLALEEQVRRLTQKCADLESRESLPPKPLCRPSTPWRERLQRAHRWVERLFEGEQIGTLFCVLFLLFVGVVGSISAIRDNSDQSQGPVFCGFVVQRAGDPWDGYLLRLVRKKSRAVLTQEPIVYKSRREAHDFMRQWGIFQCPAKMLEAIGEAPDTEGGP